MACLGCKPENNCGYPEIRSCARAKRLENCGLCRKFPCNLVSAALEESEKLSSLVAQTCEPEEVSVLYKAFFSKRQNLEKTYFRKNENSSVQEINCQPPAAHGPRK